MKGRFIGSGWTRQNLRRQCLQLFTLQTRAFSAPFRGNIRAHARTETMVISVCNVSLHANSRIIKSIKQYRIHELFLFSLTVYQCNYTNYKSQIYMESKQIFGPRKLCVTVQWA